MLECRINTEAVYDTKFHSELEVTKGSLIYTSLCKLGQLMGGGCFETRTMAVQTHMEKLNKNMFMNKYAFKVQNTKDGQTNLDIDLNTLETAPYTLKVMTPVLTEQLGRDTFLVTAARSPGKGFTVESNIRDTRFTFTHGQETLEGLKGKGFHAELRNDGDTTIKYDLFLNYEKVNHFIILLSLYAIIFIIYLERGCEHAAEGPVQAVHQARVPHPRRAVQAGGRLLHREDGAPRHGG